MAEMTIAEVLENHGGSIKTGPFGTVLKAAEYVVDGAPVISVGEVGYGSLLISDKTPRVGSETVARLSGYVLRSGDIVFGRKGAVDRSAWVRTHEDGYFLGSDGIRLRVGDTVDSRFLAYQLQSVRLRDWLLQHAAGTTMASLNQSTIERIPVVLPPLDQQRGIAEVLAALDDKIAANLRAEDAAVAMIDVLFARACVGASSRALFDVFEVDFGEAFKGSEFSAPGLGRPLIRIRDLKTFRSQIWTTEARQRETVVQPGDVVVGMDAEFRATWWLGTEGLLNQRVCRVRGKEAGNALVAEALRAPLAAIESSKSGTTVIHLNKSDLARSFVTYPDAPQREIFESQAEPILAHRVALAQERDRLTATRDELLPLLMSGKVRITDAEAISEQVL